MTVQKQILLKPGRVNNGIYETDVNEEWHFRMLPEGPVLDPELATEVSIYHLEAEELSTFESLREVTCPSNQVNDWREIGLLALTQIGWRPECVEPDTINREGAFPPALRTNAPVLFAEDESTFWLPEIDGDSVSQLTNHEIIRLEIEVAAFCGAGYGLICAGARTDAGIASAHNHILARGGEAISRSI